VGVKVLLKNREGKYLLVHRSAEKYPGTRGTWDIVGGRINPGQTLMENLRREVREETGLEIIGEPRLIAAQDILRVAGRHVIRLTYVAGTDGEPKLDTKENDDHHWLTLDELRRHDDVDIYFKELLENGAIT
jgi:ADP-ribose pyrophosphatase YjhB (NUDIX family)